MALIIRDFTGDEALSAMEDLARLRIAVFARWPYLYDGDPAYEAQYLRAFTRAADSVLVVACNAAQIVGAATASPMAAQTAEVQAPFAARGLDVGALFYFGESVLLPQYRGQGIGHAFFDHREARARRCGANAATFAAVVRPADHPARPLDYQPLDPFWRKRGYAPLEGFVTELSWTDHGHGNETRKLMQYWMRAL